MQIIGRWYRRALCSGREKIIQDSCSLETSKFAIRSHCRFSFASNLLLYHDNLTRKKIVSLRCFLLLLFSPLHMWCRIYISFNFRKRLQLLDVKMQNFLMKWATFLLNLLDNLVMEMYWPYLEGNYETFWMGWTICMNTWNFHIQG